MLKKSLLTIASLTSAGFLPFATAADQMIDDRWYISPFGTFIKTDSDRRADDGWGAGLGLGKMLKCLVPHLNGIKYPEFKEQKLWDKYYTAQPFMPCGYDHARYPRKNTKL